MAATQHARSLGAIVSVHRPRTGSCGSDRNRSTATRVCHPSGKAGCKRHYDLSLTSARLMVWKSRQGSDRSSSKPHIKPYIVEK
ncbi:MAG TPA: hypothetical protein V6D14_34620 [Coleofasciculaceae cyanobacterium]